MSVVDRAHDLDLNRNVALKLLASELAGGGSARGRPDRAPEFARAYRSGDEQDHRRGPDHRRPFAIHRRAIWALQSGTITRLDPATGRITRRVSLPAYQVGQIAEGRRRGLGDATGANGGSVLVRLDLRPFRSARIPVPTGQTSGTLTRVAVDKGAVWCDGAENGTSGESTPRPERSSPPSVSLTGSRRRRTSCPCRSQQAPTVSG
jgi:hypothetical protein